MAMNLQEVFNKIWERAKTLVRSHRSDNLYCSYRNGDASTNHCFIGILIPDELYEPDMEHVANVYGLLGKYPSLHHLFDDSVPASALDELQRIHDNWKPEHWHKTLVGFAREHNLAIPDETC